MTIVEVCTVTDGTEVLVHNVSHKNKEPFNEIIQQQVLNQQKEVTFCSVNNYFVELIATGCFGDQKH